MKKYINVKKKVITHNLSLVKIHKNNLAYEYPYIFM